jgi:hypothetical protein
MKTIFIFSFKTGAAAPGRSSEPDLGEAHHVAGYSASSVSISAAIVSSTPAS